MFKLQLLLILNLYYKHSNVQTIAVCGQPEIAKNICAAHVVVLAALLLGLPCLATHAAFIATTKNAKQ